MSIQNELLAFHKTRDFKSYIPNLIENQTKIPELINLISNLEAYPMKEMSSWILTHLVKSNPQLIQPYYPKLVDILFITNNQTVLRNCVNILFHLQITTYKEGELVEKLITFLKDNSNKVALQVYSIYCLIHFVKKYPELFDEIKAIIELNSENQSAAFNAAKRNFYKLI
ncbi:MAG: hypothetical protein HYR91_11645 [Flavobacteriia bacterium]|nr:hypothetical protein [Flavobacteriia bacterium]